MYAFGQAGPPRLVYCSALPPVCLIKMDEFLLSAFPKNTKKKLASFFSVTASFLPSIKQVSGKDYFLDLNMTPQEK